MITNSVSSACTLIMDIGAKMWLVFAIVNPYTCRVSMVSAFPIPRWIAPCYGSLNNTQRPLTRGTDPELESDQAMAHKLWIKTNTVKELVVDLKNLFARERIQSNHLLQLLNRNTTIRELADLRNLTQYTEFITILIEDYRKSAIAAMYVDQLRNDEESSPFSPSYLNHFSTIESQLYAFMCTLKISIESKGGYMPYVSRDVMYPSFRRNTTYAGLHTRTYIVLKDIAALFTALHRDYGLLKNGSLRASVSLENV